MTALEDRLRDAYRAVADTVDPATIPGLTEGTEPRATLSRRMSFVMPLVAAAAVIAVVTMSVLLVGMSPRFQARTVKTRAAAAVSFPAFALVDLGSSLKVYNTRSGAVVALVAPPAGQKFEDVASGGAARTFLAATGSAGSACHARFYRFELSATGQPSPLTFLRSVPGSQPTAVAAIPGGGSYAYSAVHCATAPPNGLIGISGQAGNHTWAYDQGDDYTFSLAATADGDRLALSLYAGSGWADLLLDTHSRAGTVDKASRILPAVPYAQTLAISPDGRTLYACASNGATGTLTAYRIATGAQIRVLHRWLPHSRGLVCQTSADQTGRFLLAAVAPDIRQRSTLIGFDLRTGASVTLPVHPVLLFRGSQLAW
jgi:hypothetical protein